MKTGEGYWLGLREPNNENMWMWSDNKALIYTNWSQGEPNNMGDEDCAVITY